MRLPIIVSHLSNFLFFIQKTTKYNLDNFDLQKYLIDENIDILFYGKNENIIWKQIKKSIGDQKTKQLQKAIFPLKSTFTSHWRETSKHLLLWKQYFQNNKLLFQQTILKVKKLNGIKHFAVSQIPIYFISNFNSKDKEINAWFSWTPKKSFIVVEIPFGLKIPNNFFPLGILAHEFFHLMLRKNKNLFLKITEIAKENEKLFTKLGKGMPNRIFFEELLISSFIPEGYLSEKYLGIKVNTHLLKPKDLLDWRRIIAYKLQFTVKKYIDNTKQINEKYLKNLIEIINTK